MEPDNSKHWTHPGPGESTPIGIETDRFPTTHWGLVLAAGRTSTEEAVEALTALCRDYWMPVYGYARRTGSGPADAQDLTQEFFARLIEKRLVARADRQRGRFRTFVLTAFKHFAVNEWEKSQAVHRGGRCSFISWEESQAEKRFLAEPVDGLTPEGAYEKRWATALLETVLRQLRAETTATGRADLFESLKDYFWGDASQATYSSIAEQLGMTGTAVKVAAHRLRQRFREVLRAEIAKTVAYDSEIEDELRHLLDVVSS